MAKYPDRALALTQRNKNPTGGWLRGLLEKRIRDEDDYMNMLQCDFGKRHFRDALMVILLSFWAVSSAAAPKTDIVLFKNGDKLTGEFKSMKRGLLNLNTDATGTIGIEWDKISSIVSSQNIQVEIDSGIRYFGTIAHSEELARINVVTDDGLQGLDIASVIEMTPIEGGGIHALDIEMSVGYDFAKAGGVKHATLGVNMDYRSLIRIESVRFSTLVTDSDSQDASRRTNLGLRHTRLWNKRWFTNSSLSFDQNDELGLNLRTSLGSGGGRYLIRSNTMLLSLEGELQFAIEDLVANDSDTNSIESVFSVNWDWFLFEDPELDWSTRFQVIPSLTENGRVRGELNSTLSWEIIGDLKWTFSYYGSWDNQPQSTAGSTSDYGINTALAYDF